MFNRFPKPRYTFDPFGKKDSDDDESRKITFKRKRLSLKRSSGSVWKIIFMVLAVFWIIQYFGGFGGGR